MSNFPKTVDCDVNGVCNLDCPWCWGPEHDKSIETVTNDEWCTIITRLKTFGVENVVFSGGEPLLRKGIDEIIAHAHGLGLHTTLSTNAILLMKRLQVLSCLDELGIPLDGSSHEKNSKMRVSRSGVNHFKIALDAIKFVQDEYSDMGLTVRSVVTQESKDDIPKIGEVLRSRGIDLHHPKFRWKVYQCGTSGPRYANIISGNHLISAGEYQSVIDEIKSQYPGINLGILPLDKHEGRYLHILPNGDARIIQNNYDGHPRDKIIGNVRDSLESIRENLGELDFGLNCSHGTSA